MHVALLANIAWLDEELTTFQAMLVGLLDEGVRTVQVVPEALERRESAMMGERVTWRQSRWAMLNQRRLGSLVPALNKLDVNLIHALDGRLWRSAKQLGEAMDVPVIYQANGQMDLKGVEPILRDSKVPKITFAATTQPLAEAMTSILGDAIEVTTLSGGVHSTNHPPRIREPGSAICAAITGDGRLDSYYHALLEGLALFVQEHPQSQFFLDSQSDDPHHLWRAVNRIGLGANLSLIPRKLGHRELLLRADLLIQPQPLGKSRSLTLAAMAHGLPVLAHHDPWLDYLIDGQTAWVVHDRSPQNYYDRLVDIITHPEHGQQLGESAQQWVRNGHLASDLIDRTLALYRTMTCEAIEFPGNN